MDTTPDLHEAYTRHARTVYRFLLSQCGSADLAEELTQETFYRAVRSIDRYNGDCKLSVWLRQIAKHLWYQHLRRQKRESPLPEDGGEELVPPGTLGRGGGAGPDGPGGLAAPGPRTAGALPGSGVSALVWGAFLPGDRRRTGENGDLGPGDLLPGQGTTENRR